MKRQKRRSRWVAVLVVAVLGYVYVQARRGNEVVESALRGAVESPFRHVSEAVHGALSRVGEVVQREDLYQRIGELEARLAESELGEARVSELEAENLRLGRLLGLSSRSVPHMRAARVAYSRTGDLLGMVVLDQGSDQGVEVDAAVVSPDGLVGRVVELGRTTSVVQLIASPSSGVGVRDERSGVQGVLFGTGGERCRLRYVPNIEDVKVGDRIVASGLDQLYPAGTSVGIVTEVKDGPEAFHVIEVTPTVRFRGLETVLVGRSGQQPLAQALGLTP